MITTEQEARTKRCHRWLDNAMTRNESCIASDCMAWRDVRTGTMNNPTRQPNTGFGTTVIGGYCGLAGKPD